MPLHDSLTLTFTGLLVVATAVYVIFTGLLWRVTRRQSDMQADLRAISIVTRKHSQDPDLRVYCNWKCEPIFGTTSSGPVTHEIWRGLLHLWNTGSSTILVTGWSLEAAEAGSPPRISDGGFPISPPIVVAAHTCVHYNADITGTECRMLIITYDTSSSTGRELRVPLRTRFGHQNKEDEQQND